MHPDRVEQED
jgi:hypothetical protein